MGRPGPRAVGALVAVAVLAATPGCGRPGPAAPDPAGGTTGATPEQLERSLRAALAAGNPPRLVVCADPATAGSALWECRVTPAGAPDASGSTVYRIRFRTERCWQSVTVPVKGCVAG